VRGGARASTEDGNAAGADEEADDDQHDAVDQTPAAIFVIAGVVTIVRGVLIYGIVLIVVRLFMKCKEKKM